MTSLKNASPNIPDRRTYELRTRFVEILIGLLKWAGDSGGAVGRTRPDSDVHALDIHGGVGVTAINTRGSLRRRTAWRGSQRERRS
jgi:hypothetical protein